MKRQNPMPVLRRLFMERGAVHVSPPVKTIGKPKVLITKGPRQHQVTFYLNTLIPGQTFLGIYPVAATLPAADGLSIGDYALLISGEIVQIF